MAATACRISATYRLFERLRPTAVLPHVSRFHSCSQPSESCTQIEQTTPLVSPARAHPLLIPQRYVASWYIDKRISGNLGTVGVAEVDPDFTPVTDKTEGQEIAQLINKEQGGHGRLFAVVSVGGLHRKVTVEDILVVESEFPPTVGDRIRLEKVLMVGGKNFSAFGQPLLSRDQVYVEATVIEKTLSHNRIWSTYKRRKRIRKLKLFRTPQTMIVINLIELNTIPEAEE